MTQGAGYSAEEAVEVALSLLSKGKAYTKPVEVCDGVPDQLFDD